MPLTFSHPAIILPLNYLPKRWISLTGLIAGSVAPDFEYFFRMKVYSIYSHTWLGLLWFDVPLGILLCFVYHNIVRSPLINNLPAFFNKRFSRYDNVNWNKYFIKNIAIVVLSVTIGSASHLFWDSFTHATGYFVVLFNWLQPITIRGVALPIYKLFQHLSTLVGTAIIIIALCKLPSQTLTRNKGIWQYWFIVTGAMLLIVGLRLSFGLDFHQYWNILVTAIAGMLLAIVLASVIIQRVKRVLPS